MLTLGHALDPASLNPAGRPAALDPAELTRHAVCVGMTGSGKTGLCVGLLESLALQGVPVLALDPKGDLANLALALDPANPAEFEPWVDPAEAARQGRSIAEHAAATARAWGEAQARDGLTPDALQARRSGVEVVVHTPGSTAGVPVDVFTALTRAPEGLDPEGLAEYVTGAVSALLSLVGLAGDPLTDPRAILLARVLGDAFARGEAAPFDVLLPRLVDPPFETLGYFSVDEVLPREERTALALALNNVAASPAFRAWLTGVPLDVGAWLQPGPSGKTPLRVLSLAHLDDRQRSFFVTMVLHAVVAWTRRLPGTGALRALVYFDEVMGYLPPHPKDPPTKAPVLTLLKQARAVGVGVVLCTQNPVDVDYKALSNAGTWFVGRLQTQQDRRRVVDGLVAASGGADPAAVDELLGRLPRRAFVWRTADSPAAQVLRTRQVLCFLRGPLTRAEIGSLGQSWTGPAAPSDGLFGEPPPVPPDVPVRWLAAEAHGALGLLPTGVWEPTLYVRFRVVLDVPGFREERVVHRWGRADAAPVATALQDAWLLRREPDGGGRYPAPPAALVGPRLRREWAEALLLSESAARPDGSVVRPDRADVTVVGWALVWAPPPAPAPAAEPTPAVSSGGG
jgi:hypothetical protein